MTTIKLSQVARELPGALSRSALLALLALGLDAAVEAATPIAESAEATRDGRVLISNVAGKIEVKGWDRAAVELTGTLGDNSDLEFNASPGLVEVEVRKRGSWRNMRPSTLVLRVPSGSDLEVNAVSADVRIEDITGEQRLESVSGNVISEARGAILEASSVSGDVRITGQDGSLTPLVQLSSVSGNGRVRDVNGDVLGESVSGDLEVRNSSVGEVRLESTSGQLRIDAALLGSGRVEAETISGDIELDLRAPDGLEVDLETHSGDIDNCRGPEAQRKRRYGPGRVLRFELGEGGGRLRAQTLSGRIEICVAED